LSAMFAPTSWGTKAWEFVAVKDPEKKKALSKATAHSAFVKDAPLVIVVCYDPKTGRRFKEDSSICAEHIHLEAVNQGLASCFVQVADAGDPPGSAEPYVKRLLNIPDNLRVQCMMPIGYAKRELAPHKDGEFDPEKIHYEEF
ncbi:MAG: nitroreductase family protein, partial [Deltaproteobacteria bacterium]|nr:nitroreductase family protein [Deltaproteobacteria bacterium]